MPLGSVSRSPFLGLSAHLQARNYTLQSTRRTVRDPPGALHTRRKAPQLYLHKPLLVQVLSLSERWGKQLLTKSSKVTVAKALMPEATVLQGETSENMVKLCEAQPADCPL